MVFGYLRMLVALTEIIINILTPKIYFIKILKISVFNLRVHSGFYILYFM